MKQILKMVGLQQLITLQTLLIIGALSFVFYSNIAVGAKKKTSDNAPATHFDLTHWNLTLPTSTNGKVDNVSTAKLQNYSNDDFFYLDKQGHMVFTSPNKGGTTQNSKNTRSELRYMSRGTNRKIQTHGARNNFAIASHPDANDMKQVPFIGITSVT